MSTSTSGRGRRTRSKRTGTESDAARLSNRTLKALDKTPRDKRARIEPIIARSQTPEARAKSAANRAILDREYRETGRIATLSEKTTVEDSAAYSQFISRSRDERLARGLSLEQLAARSKIDKAALSRLEAGKQSNPALATLMRYARALELRLTLSLEQAPRSGVSNWVALAPICSTLSRVANPGAETATRLILARPARRTRSRSVGQPHRKYGSTSSGTSRVV